MMVPTTPILLLLLVSVISSSSSATYPRPLLPEETTDHFLAGALLSYSVNMTGCKTVAQTSPPIKTNDFGDDIRHGRYVMYGPLNNLTFWRQRYVDDRHETRSGPTSRLTGVQMDATGYAYVYINDYDPKTLTRMAYLHMECWAMTGFTPIAQTPGGKQLVFDDIKGELLKGSLLSYSIYTTYCEPRPKNYTHIYVDAGPIDEYRLDEDGSVVFTYRVVNSNLSMDIITIKMTSSDDITLEKYTYSQKGNPRQLVTKTCKYTIGTFGFGVYKITSPQT
ncbi:uncharacterized protein LOC124140993 isoform X2 [Haliotis rufescens]|uniref:uncharacterized protein LOC124140993 isoform X2 n=1 Tax=Haliotis rufescens TaxID=6454 RepID=UPI00201EDDF6|nr:uncharacterized protein LOC124140993 isoform X2 [Haliotis rufescens]